MTTFLEETMREFDEKYAYENSNDEMVIRYTLCENPNDLYSELKDFITSRLILQRKEMREKIENLVVSKPDNNDDEMRYEIKKAIVEETKRALLNALGE